MKKLICFLMIIGLCATTTFAQGSPPSQNSGDSRFRVSIGGGGLFSGNFSTWNVEKDAAESNLYRYNSSNMNVAPYFLLDLKYLELNFGLLLGEINGDSTMSGNKNFPAQTLGLRGSAYLKLPFTLSSTFSMFPLLGVDYDLYLMARKSNDYDATFPINGNSNAKPIEALNNLWFKAGMGLDAFFSEHLFMRTELLYGIRLQNEMEKHLQDSRDDVNWMLGHGGDFKIAIGYRF